METLRPLLLGHPFFQGMKPEHLDVLVGCALNVRFSQGSLIFRAGEQGDYFYVLRQGRVQLEMPRPRHEPIRIVELSDGEVFGWSWLVPPYVWRFDARAKEPTRAVQLNGRCLREKWDKQHDLGFELLRRFADLSSHRIESVNRALLNLSSQEERV